MGEGVTFLFFVLVIESTYPRAVWVFVMGWEAATYRRSEGLGLRAARAVRKVCRAGLGVAAAVVSMAFERRGLLPSARSEIRIFSFHGLCLPFVDTWHSL